MQIYEELKTGFRAFDNLFYESGIKVDPISGTSILIEGGAGLGKTTLALQLATESVLKGGAVCFYYSFEQTPRELMNMMNDFGWNIKSKALGWPAANMTEFSEQLNLIDAHEVVGLDVATTLDMIESHANKLKEVVHQRTPVIVLDSIGAIGELTTLERKHVNRLLSKTRSMRGILILVREKEDYNSDLISEYLTNVVMELRKEYQESPWRAGGIIRTTGSMVPRTVIELKKTRNQRAHRGPHEFQIRPAKNSKSKGGFIVYPSLHSIDISEEPPAESIDTKVQSSLPKVGFGIEKLDAELGVPPGLTPGHSILVKGPPGSFKTQLGVQFLLQAIDSKEEDKVLFVSCRIDKAALEGVEIYRDVSQKRRFIDELLHFIDARDPYRSPDQVMASIVAAVEDSKHLRRAVIFGIGMLDTLPAFQQNALPFLQVLIGYFRKKRITGVFIDWAQEKLEKSGELIRPTQLAGDFVAGAIDINPEKEKLLTLIRKDHRFIGIEVGKLSLKNNQLSIEEANK